MKWLLKFRRNFLFLCTVFYLTNIPLLQAQSFLNVNSIGGLRQLYLSVFIMFFLIVMTFIIWLVINGKKIKRQLKNIKINKDYLKKMISQKQDSFYLWNAKGELILSSDFDIYVENERLAKNIDEFKEKFSVIDLVKFEGNFNKLLSTGAEFYQTLDLNQYNMHLLVSGNSIELNSKEKRCFVVWVRDITIEEKIQRYQTLESKETSARADLLEKALNEVAFPVWIMGEDLKFNWVNKAYVAAVDGENYRNTIGNDIELTINTLGVNIRSMAEQSSFNGKPISENHFTVIGGKRRSMDFHAIPYRLGNNKEAIFCYAQDMTELEETKENLADHTESYAETLDKFSTAVAIFGSEMRLEYYNKAYLRLWKLPESLLFSHPHYGEILEALREARKLPEQANFPEWKKRQIEAYTEVLEPVESMLHLPDGKTLRVVMQHHPLGGMLVFYEDVTDYFALESSYNTLIAVQRETLDNLHEGIAVFGVDGRLKLFNDGFINIWNISSEFLGGNPHAIDVLNRCEDLFDSAQSLHDFQNLIVGGDVKKEASSGKFELENDKVINYSLVPLPDGAVLVIFIDVTDSARVEYSLRKHNESLEEAQNIKTDFLAHMSYELRTPLNSVLGFAELLEKEYQGPLNDQQHQYMRNILSASDYLLDLINDILDLSVIEAGGLSIEATDFNLSELIDGVVTKLDERIKNKSLHLDVNYDKGPIMVLGDEKRLKHSVSNLLSNAVKFTEDSGNISITTGQDDLQYFISIKDDGVGINADEVSNIFEKFYTGSNTPRAIGTGLGLSIVKIFIEKHGGTVKVETEVGIGTNMICILPKKLPNSDEVSIDEKVGIAGA